VSDARGLDRTDYECWPAALAKQRRGPGKSSSLARTIKTITASPITRRAVEVSAEKLSPNRWRIKFNDMDSR